MKCPLLTPSRCLQMVIIPISQHKAMSVVQLWPLYAPASFSAVICAINLAECPFFYLVCVAFPNPAPSLVPLQTLTSVVCNSLSGCQPVVLLLHLCFCFQSSKRINRHCLQNCFVHFFSCLPAFFNVSLFVFSFVKT